jgi:hypothetical protein
LGRDSSAPSSLRSSSSILPLAMSVMTNATGPYNLTCDDFAKAKPAERAQALAFAQGYFASLNMDRDIDDQVNLQSRWRELNAFVVPFCTDKSNPYLYRRFVGDAAYEAFDEMRKKSPYNEGICNYHDGLCYRERPYTEEGEKEKAAEWERGFRYAQGLDHNRVDRSHCRLELTEWWCHVEEDDVHRCGPGRVDWGHIDNRARLV